MKFQADHSKQFQPYKITITVETERENATLLELTQAPSTLRVASGDKQRVGNGLYTQLAEKCYDLPSFQQTFLSQLRKYVRK